MRGWGRQCTREGFLISPECGVRFTGSRKDGIREELPLAPSFPGLIPSPLPHLFMRSGDCVEG